jgi:hypothetical protein
MRLRDLSLLLAAAAIAGCGKEAPPATGGGTPTTPTPPAAGTPPAMAPAAEEEHSHDPRYGGVMLELGDHEGHLEVVHDEKTGTLTAYVYDGNMKPVASEAPVVNLTKGGVQVTMTLASGTGTTGDVWKATHDALKVKPLDGRIRLKIGERTYQAAP